MATDNLSGSIQEEGRWVVFLAVDTIAIKEWWPVAVRLKRTPGLRPLFVSPGDFPQEWARRFDDEGISRKVFLGPAAMKVLQTIRFFRRIPGMALFAAAVEYRFGLQWARRTLRATDPAALIVLSDRLLGWPAAFVKAMNERGGASFIISAAFPAAPGAEAVLRQRSPHFRRTYSLEPWINRWVARFFPRWVYTYKGIPTLLYSWGDSLAATLTGMMPDNPWAFGGGMAGKMLVESELARDIFAAAGTKRDKMVVTGRPTVDALFELMRDQKSIRAAVCETYGIQPEKKIVLCSVPHLKEHHLLPEAEHWAEMEFLFSTLTKVPGGNVLLNLHPGCRAADYKPLADKYGAVLCEGADIYGLIPACDIYVSCYSTTVNLVMGCLKPVVIVDFYKLDYPTYDDCPGVAVVRNKAELLPLLERFATDDEFVAAFRRKQEVEAPKWVMMDGRNTERIVNEILSDVKNS